MFFDCLGNTVMAPRRQPGGHQTQQQDRVQSHQLNLPNPHQHMTVICFRDRLGGNSPVRAWQLLLCSSVYPTTDSLLYTHTHSGSGSESLLCHFLSLALGTKYLLQEATLDWPKPTRPGSHSLGENNSVGALSWSMFCLLSQGKSHLESDISHPC